MASKYENKDGNNIKRLLAVLSLAFFTINALGDHPPKGLEDTRVSKNRSQEQLPIRNYVERQYIFEAPTQICYFGGLFFFSKYVMQIWTHLAKLK